MLDKINGYKKFIVAILTIAVLVVNNVLGKQLNINIDQVAEAFIVIVSAVYLLVQAIHDIIKTKKQ